MEVYASQKNLELSRFYKLLEIDLSKQRVARTEGWFQGQ